MNLCANDLLYICLFFLYVCFSLTLYIMLCIDCALSGLLELDLSSAGALFTPNLLTSGSPMQQRRDSILKQQGSVKSDKRVSIKPTPSGSNLASLNINNNNNNNNAKMQPNVEYISEAASSSKGARLTTKPPAGECELWTFMKFPLIILSLSLFLPGPRPASLIITKNDSTSQFQLLRSSSIEYEDIEAQQQHATIVRALRTTLLEQQEDESAPLVFTVRKW